MEDMLIDALKIFNSVLGAMVVLVFLVLGGIYMSMYTNGIITEILEEVTYVH